MAREREDYRPILEEIKEAFPPGTSELTKQEVRDYVGVSVNTVNKRFRFNSAGKIHIASLALQMTSETKTEASRRR
jgi:hypothetical protein